MSIRERDISKYQIQIQRPTSARVDTGRVAIPLPLHSLVQTPTFYRHNYTISEPADRNWGVFINGSWTGLVGAMARREADLTIGDLTVHEDRSEVMHFLHPAVHTTNIKGLYKKDDVLETKWTSYITIFRSNVYLSIFGVLVLVSILFVVIARSANRPHRGLDASALVVCLDASWFTLAALAKQGVDYHTQDHDGVDYHSQGLSGRFMVVSWWIFAIIMSMAYGANLISQLSVHKEQKPFHNLAELTRNEDYSFGLIEPSITAMIFQVN
ncbi:probable glutamate receptor [Gigantopelta aegis]|uniref:probable glutamate receptor n=1 Tax=Gigantopelta aegis TaxID=1735272 RepID=UPI001B88E613|nr:probable glutamate receptor [Gigantopelta aegis]